VGAAIAAKQCRWYNKRHERKGTLWMDRYKSVLVEGRRERRGEAGASQVDVLRVMACYIDLNCPSFLRLCKKASHGRCRSRG